MNPTILSLTEVSNELLLLLKSMGASDIDTRDKDILRIEKLLNDREAIIASIDSPATSAEEIKIAKNLVQINTEIEANLERVKVQIKSDIDNMLLKKKINRKYDNPYNLTTNEGVFIDKRNL
jgi:flagellar protein FliT